MELKIIYSKREDGIMSDDEIFYPNLTEEERKNKFELNKKNFLQKYNLDNVNILIPIQKTIYEEQDETFNYQDGTYEILTKENVTKYLKGEKYFHDDFLIMDSNILKKRWKSYQKRYEYAKDINFEEILICLRNIINIIVIETV